MPLHIRITLHIF